MGRTNRRACLNLRPWHHYPGTARTGVWRMSITVRAALQETLPCCNHCPPCVLIRHDLNVAGHVSLRQLARLIAIGSLIELARYAHPGLYANMPVARVQAGVIRYLQALIVQG